MTIRTEINSQGQVVCVSSVALRPKMSHIAAAAAAAIMLVTTVTFVSGQNSSAPTNEFPNTIVLPGARSAEGIAIGQGSIFYASDFLAGDIFRGDLRTGKVERFIHPPNGRQAVGLKADIRHGLLFVAGGFTGQAYVYDLQTGADLATFQLGGLINDVVLTKDAAWFTDSATASYLSNSNCTWRQAADHCRYRAGCRSVRFSKSEWNRCDTRREDTYRVTLWFGRDLNRRSNDGCQQAYQ